MSYNNNYVDEDLCKTEDEKHTDINVNVTSKIDESDLLHREEDLSKINYDESEAKKHSSSQNDNISIDSKDTHTELIDNELITLKHDNDSLVTDLNKIDTNADELVNKETENIIVDAIKTGEERYFESHEKKSVIDEQHHDFSYKEDILDIPIISNDKNEPDTDVSKISEDEHVDVLKKRDDEKVDDTKNENLQSADSVPSDSSTKIECVEIDSTEAGPQESLIDTVNDFKIPDKESSVPVSDSDSFIDILGNNLLTKRVLVKGLGRETRPTHGDQVTIEYKAWNSADKLFAEATETFVIGDGDMVQAFDLALCLAEMHEEFELRTDARFAYGSRGQLPDVQPNESLKYQIKLLSCEEAPDYTTYNYNDRMIAADKKRERGNYLYRREEFSYAVNSYSRAIKIIETDPDFKQSYNDPSKEEMFDLFVKVTNNLAASQLKLESYDSVIETCNTILNFDATNVKALFRKGKGLVAKGSYEEALIVLRRAFELDNKNKLIANEIQKCQQLKRHEDEKSARFCRRIFGTGDSKKESADAGVSSSTAGYGWKTAVTGTVVALFSVAVAWYAVTKPRAN